MDIHTPTSERPLRFPMRVRGKMDKDETKSGIFFRHKSEQNN